MFGPWGVTFDYTAMARKAPGRLEIVQDFINTADLEDGTDEIGTLPALRNWLKARKLVRESPTAQGQADSSEALETGHTLREALRALALANNGDAASSQSARLLIEACSDLHLHLRARFSFDQPLILEAEDPGVQGGLGTLLTIVYDSLVDGTWRRLKACSRHTCQFAFYDTSRNGSGRWCSMAVCGNRTKVEAYRERRAPNTAGQLTAPLSRG